MNSECDLTKKNSKVTNDTTDKKITRCLLLFSKISFCFPLMQIKTIKAYIMILININGYPLKPGQFLKTMG